MTAPQLNVIESNEVDPDVERLWAEVFKVSAIVISHSKRFGFTGMSEADPSIEDLLVYLKLVEGFIDVLTGPGGGGTCEETRLLLNAKKQLTTLEWVAITLKRGDKAEFEIAMKNLQNQAPF